MTGKGVPRGTQCSGTTKAGQPCKAFRIGDWTGRPSHLTTTFDVWFCPMHRDQEVIELPAH